MPNKTDVITFQYTDKYERYSTKSSQIYRLPKNVANATGVTTAILESYGYGYSNNLGEVPYGALTTIQGKTMMSTITWKYGKVSFHANTLRKDITGVLLDSIRVFNRVDQPVKNIQFNYDNNTLRPFLTEIRDKDRKWQDNIGLYKFEYYGGLPGRFSNSQDAWGYYNGSGNIHLVPNDYRLAEYPRTLFNAPNANRSCNNDHMRAGTLRKIQYPTNGYTIFDFEVNRYYKTAEPGAIVPGYYTTASSFGMAANRTPPVYRVENDIVITQQGSENSRLKIQVRNYYRGADEMDSYLPRVRIMRVQADGTQVEAYKVNAFDDWERATSRIRYSDSREDLDFDLGFFVGSGTYKMIIELACLRPSGICNVFAMPTSISAELIYTKYVPPNQLPPGDNYRLAGGLRVKQITSYDIGDKVVSTKVYDYMMDQQIDGVVQRVSSGMLISEPKFFGFSYQPFICGLVESPPYSYCHDQNTIVATFSSYSLATLGLTQGGYVGYEVVTEQDDAAGVNGQTTYQYSIAQDELVAPHYSSVYQGLGWPVFLPNVSNDYKRGLLLNKTVKARVGQQYVPVIRESYNYAFNDYPGAPSFFSSKYLKVKRLTDSARVCCGLGPSNPGREGRPYEFAYGFYQLKSPWVQTLSKTIERDGIVSTTAYKYENIGNMLPTKEVNFTSTGDSIVKIYRYPAEFVNAGRDYRGVYQKMIDRNIITPVIEEQISKRATTSVVFTSYKDWFGNGNLLLPDSVLVKYQIGNPFHPEVIYNTYDQWGNILSYSSGYNSPVSLLWGYDSQYPVAKVSGSDYNKALSYVQNPSILNAPESDQQLRDELNRIRIGIPANQALVQTYTYSPLTGITSETDPAGKVIFYDYDNFGRLKLIKDLNGKILKQYDYQYQKPITQ